MLLIKMVLAGSWDLFPAGRSSMKCTHRTEVKALRTMFGMLRRCAGCAGVLGVKRSSH